MSPSYYFISAWVLRKISLGNSHFAANRPPSPHTPRSSSAPSISSISSFTVKLFNILTSAFEVLLTSCLFTAKPLLDSVQSIQGEFRQTNTDNNVQKTWDIRLWREKITWGEFWFGILSVLDLLTLY